MKDTTWCLLLLQLLLWSEVKCKTIESCDSVSIKCDDESVIAIKNAPGTITPYLLQQCNARHECDVPIKSDECVNIQYWCTMDISKLVTKKSAIMHTNIREAAIGLMSENYIKGSHQSAENINCDFTFAKQASQKHKEIKFMFYDFATFANSTDFCLKLKDSTAHPFCSGSQDFFASYGPFDMTKKKQFSIEIGSTARHPTHAPEVRFWFDIFVSPSNVLLDSMECHSRPADMISGLTTMHALYAAQPSNFLGNKNNAIVFTFGTVLGVVVIGIVCLIGHFIYRHGKLHCSGKTFRNSDYDSIDNDSSNPTVELDREDKIAPKLPEARLKTGLVSREDTWDTNTRQKKLLVDWTKDDSLPRLPRKCENDQDNMKTSQAMPVTSESICQNQLALKDDSEEATCICSSHDPPEKIHECKVRESLISQGIHDYLEIMDDLEPIHVEVHVQSPQDQPDENDDIMNDYTSLSTKDTSADGAQNNQENEYTLLGKSKSSGAAREDEAWASLAANDNICVGNAEDSKAKDTGTLDQQDEDKAGILSENISGEPVDEVIIDPMNAETKATKEQDQLDTNDEGTADDCAAQEDHGSEEDTDDTYDKEEPDYLELIADPVDLDQPEESHGSTANEGNSLNAAQEFLKGTKRNAEHL